jgi:hypothetical protein
MTYRVEYGGGDVEVPTLNAAIEGAKQAVAADDEWLRSIAFDGITAAEAFGKATAWLAGHPTGVEVGDVGWQQMGPDCTLRIHYRARG